MTDTHALDPKMRADVNDLIQQRVTEGFAPADQIMEWMFDFFEGQDFDFDALEAYVVRATREAIAAHCAAQKSWPEETDCGRLDFAFLLLEEEGIVARQNFTCCQTCGHAEIWAEIREAQKQRLVKGYVFYHAQDTESAVRHNSLYLAYGAVGKDEGAELAVAQRIAAVMQEAGFTVEWNGSTKTRIKLKDIDWKKRREECG